jgi:DNA-binding protein H-NS
MNLSNLSLSDLRALQSQVSQQLEVTAQRDIAKAREEIQAIARGVGVSLEELVNSAVDKTSRTVAVKYRNPADAEQQWTGRGRQPNWVKEWLEAGKALDALRV